MLGRRKAPITLGVVEEAMREERRGEDRRSGEDRREDAKPPRDKGAVLIPFLVLLIGLVVAASTYNFKKLDDDYQSFKADELHRHEGEAAWRARVDEQLGVLVRSESDRREQTKYLKLMARRMGLKVEEDR